MRGYGLLTTFGTRWPMPATHWAEYQEEGQPNRIAVAVLKMIGIQVEGAALAKAVQRRERYYQKKTMWSAWARPLSAPPNGDKMSLPPFSRSLAVTVHVRLSKDKYRAAGIPWHLSLFSF